jgi:hypothetical protein
MAASRPRPGLSIKKRDQRQAIFPQSLGFRCDSPGDDTTPGQIIGLQWQWTANPQIDATTGCPIDAKISNIKFLP